MAAPTIGEAFVEIRAKPDKLTQDLVPGFNTAGAQAARAFVAGFAATKIKDFLVDSFAGAEEAQRIASQTEAVIRSTGGAAGETAKDIDELTESLMRKQVVDDDVIRQGSNLILTFKNIKNQAGEGLDIFDRTTEAAVDLSKAFGQDVTNSAIQLGKALNDPVTGLTALQRVGITFTADQKKVIESLVETGQVAKAQAVILTEVESQVGGSAAAQATGADRARLAYDELKESIGTGLIPVVDTLSKVLVPVLSVFNNLPSGVQTGTVVITGFAAAAIAAASAIDLVEGAFETFAPAIEKVRQARVASSAAEITEANATLAASGAKVTAAQAEVAAVSELVAAETALAGARARVAAVTAPATAATTAATAAAKAEAAAFTASAVQQELFSASSGRAAVTHGAAADALAAETGELLLFTPSASAGALAQESLATTAAHAAQQEALLAGAAGGAVGPMGAVATATQNAAAANLELAATAKAAQLNVGSLGTILGASAGAALAFGASMGDVTDQVSKVSDEDVTNILARTNEELAGIHDKFVELGRDGKNGELEFLANLLARSEEAARRYADAAGLSAEFTTLLAKRSTALGVETEVLTDKQIAQKEATEALAAAIEAVTIRTVNSATAAAAWADSISGALGVLNGAADSTFGVVDAQEAFFAAVNDTDKAVGGAAKSTGDYERKQRALEDATRSVEDATDALREAEIARFLVALGPSSDEVVRARIAETRAVREAGDSYFNYQRAVRAAARALEEATPQASKDRRTRAELSVSSAQRAVTESAIATREAEDRLRRARNLGEATADEIKQAELDLAAAKDREVLSSIDLRDAQRDLNDVGRENLDIQDDATDAINAATAAQEAGHLASLDAADAQRALNELLNEGKEGSESLAEANKAVEEAQRAVEAATLAQRDATQALIEKNDALGGSVARTRDRFNEVRDRGTAWIAELQRSGAPIDDVRAAAALLEAELRKIGDSVSPEKRALIDPFFKEISDSIKRYAIEKLLRDNPFLNQAPQPGFKTPGVRHGGGVEGIDPPGSFGSRSLRSDEVVRVLQDGEMTLTRGQQQVFAGLLARASVSSGPSITVQILGPVTNVEDARRGAYDGALAASDVIANRQLAASMRGAV